MSPAAAIGACARCSSPVEAGDLRCALCGQATPNGWVRPAQLEVRVLRCDGCGAAVKYDVAAQAPRCAFCSSVMHVEGVTDPMEQTEWYLCFAIGPDQARAALRQWMSSLGWFRPSDLKTEASVEKLEPLWWVGWVFEARAQVSWAADSNAGARRAPWAPHSGQLSMEFENILVSASRGLADRETRALTGSYDLRNGAPEPQGPHPAIIEQFDVQRSSARERIVQTAEATAADRVARTQIPGSRHRKLKLAALIESLVTRRCAFPAYVLAYRYDGKVYRAVISGHDAGCVVGTAPYSLWKILAVVAGVGALLALIVLVTLLAS